MSGGSLDYIYYKIEEAGFIIKKNPDVHKSITLKTFGDFVVQLAKVMHDVEWFLSGDIGLEDAENSIRKLMGEEFKKQEITLLKEEAKEIIEQLKKIIES